MGPNVLLFFVKFPTPGKVKTRLAKTVGEEKAVRLYSDLVWKNLKVIAPLSRQGICDLVIVFDPPEKSKDFKRWLALSGEYWPQYGKDLSERLTHAFHEAFQKGGKRVMALGSDTLGLTSAVIEESFKALDSEEVVIGPAKDGGYYLIGLSGEQPGIFKDIPWSTPDVLSATLTIIKNNQWKYRLLVQLEDLDEMESINQKGDAYAIFKP